MVIKILKQGITGTGNRKPNMRQGGTCHPCIKNY